MLVDKRNLDAPSATDRNTEPNSRPFANNLELEDTSANNMQHVMLLARDSKSRWTLEYWIPMIDQTRHDMNAACQQGLLLSPFVN